LQKKQGGEKTGAGFQHDQEPKILTHHGVSSAGWAACCGGGAGVA
jgi:hypothetical protein